MARSVATLGLVLAAAGSAAAATCDNNKLQVSYQAPVIADGWEFQLVAQGLKKPRGLIFDSEGALIVVDSGVGLIRYTLKDDGGVCVSVDEQKTLLDSPGLNHGIELSEDGKTLYASSQDRVYSWAYDAKSDSLSNDTQVILVNNMTNSDHMTRTLLLSRKEPNTLVVSRGSNSNQDNVAKTLDSGRAQIRRFDISNIKNSSDAQDYREGKVLGWGLRNSVGVAEHPVDGGIWSVENSRDEMKRHGQDIHKDNPGEELNFHGYLNGSKGSLDKIGGNYGYPTCFALWSTKDFPDVGDMKTGSQFPGPESEDVSDDECNSDYVAPRLTFQAHMAPLDIKFNKDGDQAYVTFHGSWDRDDPVGYKVSSVAWSNGEPKAASDSQDGTVDIITNEDLSKCPDECFRPAGLAWDSNQRLWFTSDATGEVFVLRKSDNSTGGDSGNSDDDDSAGASLFVSKLSVAIGAVAVGLLLA